MLSYRHAFHAGNHADVLKHCVLIALLRHLNQKETPYAYIDTHAGAGLYSLTEGYATRNAEFLGGIARLWEHTDLPEALADYRDLVRSFNTGAPGAGSPPLQGEGLGGDGVPIPPSPPAPLPQGERGVKLRFYPGSPLIAQRIMRPGDKLRLFELHPNDHQLLVEHCRPMKRQAQIQKLDGFSGLKAVLPPPSRRGLVLIDPSYENKDDCRQIIAAVQEGLKRFATGIFAIWYPCLQRQDIDTLRRKLRTLPVKWLDVTLNIQHPSADGFGMHGSGMFIINPPWQLDVLLQKNLAFLVKRLGRDEGARFTMDGAS
ncbi:MAG: 23S rRNA (adenine(2030)-N(6))-methyltransferase RlmJ [Proteobacteria bacterium]|nr:23S rRNA (adenine(2030)-N(6))-methyltransferase RlmJ [Pseudomonadota bacterium]MCL2307344.1 23S rRNA (adenine(2030)-N(6))-methyltransferase RlmJ [Pseudomonadota bacterium]